MKYYELFALLVFLTALISFINEAYFKQIKTIGLVITSCIVALGLAYVNNLSDEISIPIADFINDIDFKSTLLDSLLGYLIFAGSLHINAGELKKYTGSVIYLASIGVLISTLITGSLLYALFHLFHISISVGECFVFGALISPTDAIAVLAIFKNVRNTPNRLKVIITGESLFNDAAGIVLLSILSNFVFYNIPLDAQHILEAILVEVGGAILLGTAFGAITTYAIRRSKSADVVILLTIATSSCGYIIAQKLHVSGVITMVIAGLIIGYHKTSNLSHQNNIHVLKNFWELIDELLNAVLFVLIGLIIVTTQIDHQVILVGLYCVLVILFARFVSIILPNSLLSRYDKFVHFTFKESLLMTWGGMRGGISIALALSVPHLHKDLIAITYVVVISSILLQGATFKRVAKKLLGH
jgi:CPA1 family monovalent cation:H+ antiporter